MTLTSDLFLKVLIELQKEMHISHLISALLNFCIELSSFSKQFLNTETVVIIVFSLSK